MALPGRTSPAIIIVIRFCLFQCLASARSVPPVPYDSYDPSSSLLDFSGYTWLPWAIPTYVIASYMLAVVVFTPFFGSLNKIYEFITRATTASTMQQRWKVILYILAPLWTPIWWPCCLIYGLSLYPYWLGKAIAKGAMAGLEKRRRRDLEGAGTEMGDVGGPEKKVVGGELQR